MNKNVSTPNEQKKPSVKRTDVLRAFDAFDEVLKMMPEHFTSNHFCHIARDLGVNDHLLRQGVAGKYLVTRCKRQSNHPKIWEKTTEKVVTIVISRNIEKSDLILDAIALLKENGYKILKATYNEI